jgi:putative intracellular protease/amidase
MEVNGDVIIRVLTVPAPVPRTDMTTGSQSRPRRPSCSRPSLSLLLLVLLSTGACGRDAPEGEEGISILMLQPTHWGLNYFLMTDQFDRMGWRVEHIGVDDSVTACPYAAGLVPIHPIVPSRRVEEVVDLTGYDALIIPPGTGQAYPIPDPFRDLLDSRAALDLVARAARSDLPVYGMCANVRVLAAAGVLNGRRIVGSPRFLEEYRQAGAFFAGNEANDTAPLIDGPIITGTRGQYYDEANTRAIALAIELRQPRGPLRARILPLRSEMSAMAISGEIVQAMTWTAGGGEGIRAVASAAAGGAVVVGYTFSTGRGDADLLLARFDAAGEVVWARSFGGPGTEYGNDVLAVPGGWVATGFTTSSGAGSRDVLLVRFDRSGEVVWSHTFGDVGPEEGVALAPAGEGFLVAGWIASEGTGEEDVLVLRTDAEGRLVWQRTYGGHRSETGNGLCPSGDGGHYLSASTGTFGGSNSDLWLLRLDAAGDTLWTRAYGPRGRRGYGFDWGNGMAAADDGGVLLFGYTDSVDIMDGWAVRVGTDGDTLWTRTVGRAPFYDYITAAVPDGRGGFGLAVVTKDPVPNPSVYDNDIMLVHLERDGTLQEQDRLVSPGNQWAAALRFGAQGPIVYGQTRIGDRPVLFRSEPPSP